MRPSMITGLSALSLLLVACGGGGGDFGSIPTPPSNPYPTPSPTPTPTPTPTPAGLNANDWDIGPVINGENYSVGTPPHPTTGPDGLMFEIPWGPGHINYVTRSGSVAGATAIRMKFRIETDGKAVIIPKNCIGSPALLTIYFQRSGDDWSSQGKFEAYRWWASFATMMPLVAGEYEMVAPLNGKWTAVGSSTSESNRSGFQEAVANSSKVGFTFGGCSGLGHGIETSFDKSRFILLDFKVER